MCWESQSNNTSTQWHRSSLVPWAKRPLLAGCMTSPSDSRKRVNIISSKCLKEAHHYRFLSQKYVPPTSEGESCIKQGNAHVARKCKHVFLFKMEPFGEWNFKVYRPFWTKDAACAYFTKMDKVPSTPLFNVQNALKHPLLSYVFKNILTKCIQVKLFKNIHKYSIYDKHCSLMKNLTLATLKKCYYCT